MSESAQPQILVRSLRHDDIEQLGELSRRTIDRCYRTFLGDEAVDGYIESGAIEAFIDERIDCCRILEVDGLITGFAVCHNGMIELIMIEPELQRRGLGKMLLNYCEQEQYHFAPQLILDSFADNTAANAFFAQNGWRAHPPETDDQGTVKIVFTKDRPADWQPMVSPPTPQELEGGCGGGCGGSDDGCEH